MARQKLQVSDLMIRDSSSRNPYASQPDQGLIQNFVPDYGLLRRVPFMPPFHTSASTSRVWHIIDFQFQRRLKHLVRSVAHHHLEHIVRRWDRCRWRKNLIVFGHDVASLLSARRQPGSLIDHREVTSLPSPFRAPGRRRISTSSDNSFAEMSHRLLFGVS